MSGWVPLRGRSGHSSGQYVGQRRREKIMAVQGFREVPDISENSGHCVLSGRAPGGHFFGQVVSPFPPKGGRGTPGQVSGPGYARCYRAAGGAPARTGFAACCSRQSVGPDPKTAMGGSRGPGGVGRSSIPIDRRPLGKRAELRAKFENLFFVRRFRKGARDPSSGRGHAKRDRGCRVD